MNIHVLSIISPGIIMCFSIFRKQIYYNFNALLALILFIFYIVYGVVSENELTVGFYSKSCPRAESLVANVVKEAASKNPRIPAILLRLQFHDCFIEGCDGSILIENGENGEKHAFGHQGVGGFEEISNAKTQLEAECPGVVSCSDIVALAARDAVVLSNGPRYEVQTGRRDSRVSNKSLADDLPDVDDSIQILKSKFAKRGLSEKDLVLLSGAHTIGTTACFFMGNRLYNFNGEAKKSDPAINTKFVQVLKTRCPQNGDVNIRIALDEESGLVFDDQILHNIKNGFAAIGSDARLNDDDDTKEVIDSYVGPDAPPNSSFFEDFAIAMVRLGRLGVKTGTQGEIRKICSSFN